MSVQRRIVTMHLVVQGCNMSLSLSQVFFAQHLNKQYGKQIAKNYIELVTSPGYMSKKAMGKAKQALGIANAKRCK